MIEDKITQCEEDIAKLQENLAQLKKEKELSVYKRGDRFKAGNFEYLLTELEYGKWALVNTSTGGTGDGIHSMFATNGWITGLPTCIPQWYTKI